MTVLHSKVTSLDLEFPLVIDQLLPVVQDPSIDVRGNLDLLEPDRMEPWDDFGLVEVRGVNVVDPVSGAGVPPLGLVAGVHLSAEQLGHRVVEPSKSIHHIHPSNFLPLTKI